MTSIRTGEVWLAELDPVVGLEQGGRRPVVVVSSNGMNALPIRMAIVVPLTARDRGLITQPRIASPDAGLSRDSFARPEDVRSIDTDRLRRRLGEVSPRSWRRSARSSATSSISRRTSGGIAVDFKLELVLVPVTDVDLAKAFYADNAGFRLDVDHTASEDFRIVQFTPPGSACSISMGIGITSAPPGSAQGLHLVVTDIEAAREELVGRGVEVTDVKHMGAAGWEPGVHPERARYGSYAEFKDPDGNLWILQEVPL